VQPAAVGLERIDDQGTGRYGRRAPAASHRRLHGLLQHLAIVQPPESVLHRGQRFERGRDRQPGGRARFEAVAQLLCGNPQAVQAFGLVQGAAGGGRRTEVAR
jgi:hypothetical protein